MDATSTMSTLLENLGTVATSTLGVVGDVAEQIVSTPLLLLTTGVLFLGAAIGILGRMLSKS